MMRIPLATDLISRDGTVDQDAKLANAYVGDAVFKRPGSIDLGVIVAGAAQVLACFDALARAVIGDALKTISITGSTASVTATNALSPTVANDKVQTESNGAARATQQLMIKNSTQAWIYTP